ncbi:hypothetical protein [Maricaulis sp.]|uniref:hypothetical protein n=1 Tax=Maricaulis sp. TaxID=1486257 RepID=UPI003A9138FE
MSRFEGRSAVLDELRVAIAGMSRASDGRNQAALARFLGIGASAVSRIGKGERGVSAVEAKGCEEFFGRKFGTGVDVLPSRVEALSYPISEAEADVWRGDMRDRAVSTWQEVWGVPSLLPDKQELIEIRDNHCDQIAQAGSKLLALPVAMLPGGLDAALGLRREVYVVIERAEGLRCERTVREARATAAAIELRFRSSGGERNAWRAQSSSETITHIVLLAVKRLY